MDTSLSTNTNTKNNIVALTMADDLMLEMKRIDDEIRQFAFHLFQNRGAFPGMALEDWLKAEQALLRPVAIDIDQTNKEVIVRADVPGFNESDLKVRIDKHCLRICGKTEQHRESHEGDATSSEKSMRKIRTEVELPDSVDGEHSSYQVTDGVLVVTMPKLHKKEKTGDKKAA